MDFSKVQKTVFPNGFRLLTLHDPDSRSASAHLMIGSGSRLERPDNSGVSHFIEHMLFKGTTTRSARDIAEQTDRLGGNFNAYTTKEYTCLHAKTLASRIDQAIDILGDLALNSRFADEDIETERGVILEEIGMYEDDPEELLADTVYSVIWPDSMLGANILGTRETVGCMNEAHMRAHLREQYSPQRMVLAVCGAFDREEITAQAGKLFGSLENTGVPYEMTRADFHCDSLVLPRDFEQLHVCIAFDAVAADDDARFPLTILTGICGGSSSSRLYQRVREQLGLAYSVYSATGYYSKEGFFTSCAAVSPKNDFATLEEMTRVMCRLKKEGVTPDEFERAREQILTNLIMGIEGNSSAASHIGRGELLMGRVRTEDELIGLYQSVTIDDVNEAARRFIDFDNFSLCAVGKVRNAEDYIRVVREAAF